MCLPCIDFLRKSRFYYMMEWKLEVVLDYQQLLMTIWDFFAVDLGNECVLSKINLFFFFFLNRALFLLFADVFISGYWAGGQLMKEVERSKLGYILHRNLGGYSAQIFCFTMLRDVVLCLEHDHIN